MTKEYLNNYIKLQSKANKITSKLKRIYNNENNLVTDSVKASSRRRPYQEQIVVVTGLDQRQQKEKTRLERELHQCTNEIAKARLAIEAFIEDVEDCDVRTAIEYYYINGCTWQDVSILIKEDAEESYARKLLDRFLDNIN